MPTEKKIIYLDNNATTPVDPRVMDAMLPYFTKIYGNPNSTHTFGVQAYEAVKNSRKKVADLIGAETNEIIFTSGATEAINLAVKGVAENYAEKGKHILTVTTEHSAVLDVCRHLEKKGYKVTYLPVKQDGLIDLAVLKNAIQPDTILVSVMFVNNETGVIQPIKEIAEITHSSDALFMTDATQAVGKIPIDIDDLGIDLLCMSGHKFYAPKGIGALYFRQKGQRRIRLPALLHGGGHERGFRSGTLNVPGIVALGKAADIAAKEMTENARKVGELRDYLESEILKIEGTSVNGNKINRLYNVTNILFKGVDSDAILMGLNYPEEDLPIITVSSGSACTSTNIDPSHVLIAMGLDENLAYSCIRFSFGKSNREQEIIITINAVKKTIQKLRQMVS